MPRWRAASMTRRFALAAAGLAAAAVLLVSLASWWLINLAQQDSIQQLAATQRQFRAEAIGNELQALAERMTELAGSTILATGLVDSIGRETYLAPFLAGIRQINGIPVQVLFTDFEGQEIASNGMAHFDQAQLAWLRSELDAGRSNALIFEGAKGTSELVALETLRYSRTSSPEGALFFKITLDDLSVGHFMQLEWGNRQPAAKPMAADTEVVAVPPLFASLGLHVRSLQPATARLADLAPQYLAIVLIATALFGFVVLVGDKLAKLVTQDLASLQDFASRFVGSGLGRARAPEGGSQEVASLASSINTMLDRLDEQHSTLLQEREKLSRLTEALQAADRRKDDFLAMLAHELRNPLAPIMTGSELLKRTPNADPRVLRTSEIIARQANHMREILDDLLDVSRVTRGQVSLDVAPQDFASVVSMAVEQVRPLIEQHQHVLHCDLGPEALVVLGDRARLIQILSNLLTNAAKYTPAGGRISLQVQATPERVITTVQDNGDGIAAELMPAIFDLFSQGSRAADRKQGGLGLGLALVKQLVGLHGGSITANSEGPGTGAIFRIELPRHDSQLAIGDGQTMPAAAELPPGPLRVVIVDDNADAAHSLAAMLEMHGHSTLIAHDGNSALAMLEGEPVDAFLLDIGLPGMNGYELADMLRARPQTRDATLIAITGYGQPADRARSVEAGFHHHLVKPVDVVDVLTALQRGAHQPVASPTV